MLVNIADWFVDSEEWLFWVFLTLGAAVGFSIYQSIWSMLLGGSLGFFVSLAVTVGADYISMRGKWR